MLMMLSNGVCYMISVFFHFRCLLH